MTITRGARVRLVVSATRPDWWPVKAVAGAWVRGGDACGTVITEPDDDGCVLVVLDRQADRATDADGDGSPMLYAWTVPVRALEAP
jgi:hypothetical protein